MFPGLAVRKPMIGFQGEGQDMCHTTSISCMKDFFYPNGFKWFVSPFFP